MNTQYGANIRKEFNFNQGEALYIINSKGIEYHQHEVLHIIKPRENAR